MFMAAAAFAMALVGTSVKWATEGLPSGIVVFFRNLFGLAVLLPIIARPGSVTMKTSVLPFHVLRALFGLCAMYSYFYAIDHLALGKAVMLNFTSPLFIPIIARIWLKEKITPRIVGAVLVGFVGVGFIEAHAFREVAKPGELFGSSIALLSAVFASCALVTLRKLGATEPATRTVFYFALGGAVMTAFPLPFVWKTPQGWEQWLPLFLSGATASIAQWLLSKGFALAPAAVAAPVYYLTVPLAAIIGHFVFHDHLDRWSLVGGALVCIAGILVSLPPMKKGTG
jgi:drug/metabolite transporter (DMT)-like permease